LESVPLIACLPFVVLLLAIAILPLIVPRFWDRNRNKAIIAAAISLPILVYLLANLPHELARTMADYVSFIVLLGSLFVISGGIIMTGDLRATPRVIATFLLVGALLANFVGTTGASMLLIRPLLSTIKERKHTGHIPVFFIFVVSNLGGCLTPLGDPPLFLGFLKGVPFLWTFKLFPEWLVAVTLVLIVFYVFDSVACRREKPADIARDESMIKPLRFAGLINLLFLGGVIAAAAFQLSSPFREIVMVAMAFLSLVFTSKKTRERNHFTYRPIVEVAVLFAGIFITIVPLLTLLSVKGVELSITKPWQFFWLTGGLSSILDNAPTYLAFFSLGESVTRAMPVGLANAVAGVHVDLLRAISCGAVFMGAMSYIGNGPNFMVKTIAESHRVKVPHFFGYMAYSTVILLPIFLVITLLFFRQ
jgi:Na+/H+ antiporter NhaD/arsenite permease-like protein